VLPPVTAAVERALKHPLVSAELVEQIYRVKTAIPGAWTAISYIFVPVQRKSGAVIFHQGHLYGTGALGDLEQRHDKAVLEELLGKGIVVAYVNMPFMGENPKPVKLKHRRLGEIYVHDHNQLAVFESQMNIFRPFFEPLRAVHEEVRRMLGNERICLLGLSGGGWTVTVYAAAEPSVSCTISVAGTLPTALRSDEASLHSWGDYEQYSAQLLDRGTYTEMYTLAALEAGRVLENIYIEGDPCCFSLSNPPDFEKNISAFLLREKGGSFRIIIDRETRNHLVGNIAIERVMRLVQS
jgi:dienelactone hydrolase